MKPYLFLFIGTAVVCSCKRDEQKPVVPADTVRFFAFGDWGRRGSPGQVSLASGMKQQASRKKIDFILSLGDNFYPDGVSSTNDSHWNESFSNVYGPELLQIPWYVALGNHDYHDNPMAQIDFTLKKTAWTLPSTFYTKKIFMKDGGVIRLIVLDTNPLNDEYYSNPQLVSKFRIDSAKQKIWMDSILSIRDSDWVIISGHHPVYTGGARVGDPNSVARHLLPVFSKHSVRIYFAGHEHDLQHLKSPETSVHQFVSGAGSDIRATGNTSITRFSASVNGFMSAEITREVINVSVLNDRLDTLYKTQITKP